MFHFLVDHYFLERKTNFIINFRKQKLKLRLQECQKPKYIFQAVGNFRSQFTTPWSPIRNTWVKLPHVLTISHLNVLFFFVVSDFFPSVTSNHHGVPFYLQTKYSAQFLKPTLPLTPSITVFVFKTSTPALLEGNYDPIQVMGRQPPRIALKERIYQEAKLRSGCSRLPNSYLNRLDPTLPTYSNKWV